MALTQSQVLQLRNDLSPFLFHLTRTGSVKVRKDLFPQLQKDQVLYRTAKERLERILDAKAIRAISSFGYFHYKVPIPKWFGGTTNPGSSVQRAWLKAVCFTETPFDHIQIQMQQITGRQLNFEPYGLAFTEDFIRRNQGNPVMYFDSSNEGIVRALDAMALSTDAHKMKSVMPLYESFGKRLYHIGSNVDFRWEREWRTLNDLAFTFKDVVFGLCKTSDIPHFEKIVGTAFPFVDPVGNNQHIQQVKSYLRGFSHLAGLK